MNEPKKLAEVCFAHLMDFQIRHKIVYCALNVNQKRQFLNRSKSANLINLTIPTAQVLNFSSLKLSTNLQYQHFMKYLISMRVSQKVRIFNIKGKRRLRCCCYL